MLAKGQVQAFGKDLSLIELVAKFQPSDGGEIA